MRTSRSPYCGLFTSKKLKGGVIGLVAEVEVLVAVMGLPRSVQLLKAAVGSALPTT